MHKIKNQNLAQLLMQLRFTPQKKMREQLDSVEELLTLIDKDKEYPFEFVCFRITDYRPKADSSWQPIKGDELAEDLQVFISKLSGQLAAPVRGQHQKVYNIDELAKTFSVSTKTIHRWRKRGLIARKFIFDDGQKRFGFVQSAVDKFLKQNPTLVDKAKNFTQLTKKQKQQIIKWATAFAANTIMSRYQIINKISSKIGRSHETVRYTILNHEKSNPDKPIFSKSSAVISPSAAGEIYRFFKDGRDIKELMERFGRSKSSIYRIINRGRARSLQVKKIEFIASNEFLEDGAKEKILAEPISDLRPPSLKTTKLPRLTSDSLPEFLKSLKDIPLLNREHEVELFRRYNYLKYLASLTRADIKTTRIRSMQLERIEMYLAEAEEIKNIIIEANLRLVVSIANKHSRSGANLPDLVGEGNISLMRAVEKFDYTKGFRFSTYASWAIAKDYAKQTPTELYFRQLHDAEIYHITKDYAKQTPTEAAKHPRETVTSMENVDRDLRTTAATEATAIEWALVSLSEVIKDNLNEREQYIILNHFGIIGSPIKKETKTLKKIGQDLNLSKERVRQIELVALQKLRQYLSPEEFELLTR